MSKFYRPNKPFLKLQVSEKGHGSDESESGESETQEQEEKEASTSLVVNHKMPTPRHLLFVALLEHLCTIYESDPAKSKRLFQALSRQLSKSKMMNPLTGIDELSTIKSQYKKGFFGLMRGALAEINQGDPSLTLRDRTAIIRQPRICAASYTPYVDFSDVFNFHTSRYRDEFVEHGHLGRGAYGCVFQAKNKLDTSMYAVKKIIFPDTKPEVLLKILREVRYLSSLSHTNIVRYYTAWLEQEPVSLRDTATPNSAVFEGSSVDPPEYSVSHWGVPALTYHDNDRESNVDDAVTQEELSESIVFENASLASLASRASHITVLESDGHRPVRPTALHNMVSLTRFHVAMYIQMELCVCTLTEWINSRNTQASQTKGGTSGVDEAVCRRIMHQVLRAVQHIHSQHLMHRDLKPKNIFLSYTQEDEILAKVGDFGLSRHLDSVHSPDVSDLTFSDPPPPPMTPHPGAPHTPPVDGSGDFTWSMFTSGVGTTIYAAPEQLAGSQYDQKSDVYSLGLIMYELYQVFGTAMERVHCLTQARKNAIPDSFKQQWPIHSQYIERMLSKDPECRPSIQEILHGELFKSKEEIIKDLSASLQEQKTQISELTDTVDAQRTEIAKLRRELADLKHSPIPPKLFNS